ncbi:MAG: hypothetical protein JWM59_1201 [Verrucomicrobiales bacterium]|nr:hypothetical protein [Verrucomicrobiales bacterium]
MKSVQANHRSLLVPLARIGMWFLILVPLMAVAQETSRPSEDPPVQSATGSETAPAAASPEEQRTKSEKDEELPQEFEPDRLIPFQQSQVELPRWQERERSEILNRLRPANQGGGLFPPQIWPMQPTPGLEPLSPDYGHSMNGQETAPAGVLSPEWAAVYFEKHPDQAFLDPQHLLDGPEAVEMESRVRRWLNGDIHFRTTLLVFGPGQKLPAGLDIDTLMRRWFENTSPGLLVFYYFQEPDRTQAVFSAGAARRFPVEQLDAVMTDCIRDARRTEGGTAQLQRFCYKAAVRLHQLAFPGSLGSGRREGSSGIPAWQCLLLVGVMAVMVAGPWLLFRRRRVATPHSPVFLPMQDFHPRLGAPHCGGCSAVLTFPPVRRKSG